MVRVLLLIIFLSSCSLLKSPYDGLNLRYGIHGENPIEKLKIKSMTVGGKYPDYIIHCEIAYVIDDLYKESCQNEIEKFLIVANREFFQGAKDLAIVSGVPKVHSFCADTFIPGREALDCYENIYVELKVNKIASQ